MASPHMTMTLHVDDRILQAHINAVRDLLASQTRPLLQLPPPELPIGAAVAGVALAIASSPRPISRRRLLGLRCGR